jgi:hypothetical protein
LFVNFPCPRCEKSINALAESAGRSGMCGHCWSRITVPTCPVDSQTSGAESPASSPPHRSFQLHIAFLCPFCSENLEKSLLYATFDTRCPGCHSIFRTPSPPGVLVRFPCVACSTLMEVSVDEAGGFVFCDCGAASLVPDVYRPVPSQVLKWAAAEFVVFWDACVAKLGQERFLKRLGKVHISTFFNLVRRLA